MALFSSKKRIALFVILISVLFLLRIKFLITKTSAASAQESITATLEQLNITDAYHSKTIKNDGEDYLVYHSNETGCDYRFAESSGVLTAVTNLRGNNPSSDTYSLPLSDSKRQKHVMDYATKLLQNALIGQLEIVEEHDADYAYYYTIKEYHEEVETGTNAFIICYADGWISVCNLTYGKVYTKNSFGSIFLNNNDPLIGEQAAISLALDFVEEHAASKGNTLLPETVTITNTFHNGEQCYKVYVDTVEPGGYVVTYVLCLEVHSGEIFFWTHTQ